MEELPQQQVNSQQLPYPIQAVSEKMPKHQSCLQTQAPPEQCFMYSEIQDSKLKQELIHQDNVSSLLVHWDHQSEKDESESYETPGKGRKEAYMTKIRKIPSQLHMSYEEIQLADSYENQKENSPLKQQMAAKDYSNYAQQILLTPFVTEKVLMGVQSRMRPLKKMSLFQLKLSYYALELIPKESQSQPYQLPLIFIQKAKMLINDGQYSLKLNYFDQIAQFVLHIALPNCNPNNDSQEKKGASDGSINHKNRLNAIYTNILIRRILSYGFMINQPLALKKTGLYSGQSIVEGQILRKSWYFSGWDKTYSYLNHHSLLSYKAQGKSEEKPKKMGFICEIWTRFQMQNGRLVFKVWHGKEKIGLGLPLSNWTDQTGKTNWVYHLISQLLCQD